MMRLSLETFSAYSLLVSTVLFSVGAFTSDLMVMNIAILIGWTSNLLYALSDWKRRTFFTAFQITFFVFLLGRTITCLLTGEEDIHSFPKDILVHADWCIFLAILSLRIGYVVVERIWPDENTIMARKITTETKYASPKYRAIRLVSKILFYVTYPCRLVVEWEAMRFVSIYGYADSYVNFSSQLPYFIVQMSAVCLTSYFLFLATMPSRKEFTMPTILYMASAMLGCLAGKRSDLVVPILVYVLYCLCRNQLNRGPTLWITRHHLIILAVASPLLFIALYAFGISRHGTQTTSGSATEKLIAFFDGLGFSRNIINYEKYYEDQIPDKYYSIGDTVDYLRENVLTQLFFKLPMYRSQTVEKALNGNNFSQTITYLYSERYYLAGRGLGSCYIAEAYHDFGYFGILLWSFIYCIVLKKFYSFQNQGIISVSLALLALKYLLLAPRTMASTFLSEYVNINTWLTIGLVFLVAHIVGKSTAKSSIGEAPLSPSSELPTPPSA